ncbi:MAG: low molecular weight phosphotyrosine protein phosphatase [Cocleimonas sp.]|nr:low molecular weight phosphotyrosine protein phosphatase [Cocleimonas sp.]
MGNICRSPTAHGVFEQRVKSRHLDQHIFTDSAGTHAYHVDETPDSRSQSTAQHYGVDISKQRAQKVKQNDFETFDYIIAMDSSNYNDLKQSAPKHLQAKIFRFMSFAPNWSDKDVPDPYYGGTNGFDKVFKMIEDASEGLLDYIQNNDIY